MDHVSSELSEQLLWIQNLSPQGLHMGLFDGLDANLCLFRAILQNFYSSQADTLPLLCFLFGFLFVFGKEELL